MSFLFFVSLLLGAAFGQTLTGVSPIGTSKGDITTITFTGTGFIANPEAHWYFFFFFFN